MKKTRLRKKAAPGELPEAALIVGKANILFEIAGFYFQIAQSCSS